jgi:hypothetical protein
MNRSADFLTSTVSSIHDRTGFGFKTVGLALIVAIVVAARSLTSKAKGKLPSGPPGLPILGNLLQLSDRSWLTFTEWKKKYGQYFHLRHFNSC